MSNTVKPPKMGAISKVFAGMEVIDGVKKTRDEFKNTNNVYDDKLGVNMKGHKTPKLASEELDDLVKMAGVGGWTMRAAKDAAKKGLRDFDADTAKSVAGAISSAKNKQLGSALKNGAKALPGVALNAGLAVGGGVGVTKGLDALDKKNTEENKMSHKIIGATVGAGLAATALTGGGLSQSTKIVADNVKNTLIKHPLKQYTNSNSTAKAVKEMASKVSGGVSKATSKDKKVNDKAADMVRNFRKAIDNKNPKYIQNMGTGLNVLKSDARSAFKDRFLIDNPSATPEQISKAWLRSDERKEFKKILDRAKVSIRSANQDIASKKASEELDDLMKMAGIDVGAVKAALKPAIGGAKKAGVYIGDKIITPSLTAMSTTAAPVIATTLLSQRMMNQAKEEKEEAQQAQQAQPAPQPQTLVIRVDNGMNQSPEKTAAVNDQSHDIGNVLAGAVKDLNQIKGAEKLRTEKLHIGNGRKKLFRMQEQHGMDGMQP